VGQLGIDKLVADAGEVLPEVAGNSQRAADMAS
jgi:hypothetical protein